MIHHRPAHAFCLGAILLAWLACSGWGQLAAPRNSTNMVTMRSTSQQFIVHGTPLANPKAATADGSVRMDPSLLVVTCERVRQAVLRELDAPDVWRGKIHVTIFPTYSTNRPADIRGEWFSNGWQYHLYVPSTMRPERLVRALTHAVLLEICNREGTSRLAEVPLWVSEGMTMTLLAQNSVEYVLRPESRLQRAQVRADPIKGTRNYLYSHPACSFAQMGLPTQKMTEGEAWRTFQHSSHWLVASLLKMPDGRACFREMLRLMPRHLNWQFAFLGAYANHFQSLLDVEKWWALRLANARGRDQLQGWSRAASRDKLREIVRLPTRVRASSRSLPESSEISIQKLIELWEFPAQRQALDRVIRTLAAMRANCAPEVLPLVADYQRVLERYLGSRAQAGFEPRDNKGRSPLSAQRVIQQTLRQLDALDARLEALREAPAATPAPARAPARR